MNTAPKLPKLPPVDGYDKRVEGHYSAETLQAYATQAIADHIAALAPPSGEGVDTPLVQRLGMLVTMLRAEAKSGRRGYNFGEDAANRRSGRIADEIEQAIHEVRVLGKSHPQTAQEAERCRTTPQSAPVDGEPVGELIADGQPAMGSGFIHSFASPKKLPAGTKVFTTPPPASQERDGEATISALREIADAARDVMATELGEIACFGSDAPCEYALGLLKNKLFNYKEIVAAASPPSSAAEASINPPGIDSKLIPDAAEQAKSAADRSVTITSAEDFTAYKCRFTKPAAEQAKSVGCSHCWGDRWMKDGTPCPACNPSGSSGHEQASSAAEGPKEVQEECNPCIECGADPGEPCYPNCCTHAAEQAKPDDIFSGIRGNPAFTLEGLNKAFAEAEQAQAGELPELPEAAGMAEFGRAFTADQMREYRLAGGVTVDDAMVERAWMAYTHRDTLGQAYANDAKHMTREERRDMRAALVAALENGRG